MRLSIWPGILRTVRPGKTRPVHVNFVIDCLSHAGTESQLLSLIRHLDRSVVQPSLCLLNGAGHRELWPADCPVIDLGVDKLFSRRAIEAGFSLAAFWRRQRVDVVQTYFVDSTYFAVPLARFCGIPCVIRVRNNVGYWLTRRHRLLGRFIGRLSTTLTNSEAGRRTLMAVEGLAPNRIRLIENGVDLERFDGLRPPDTGRHGVRIGCVANLRPVKNITGLIRVATVICARHPNAQFVVAGTGEQREDLRRQIDAAGLAGRFQLLGATDDVPGFLADVDIAVNCSHSESMSNAVLEYMAAGRAIVVTDVGANARLIRHEREGLVVPADDDAALTKAILQLLGQPSLAQQCARSAQRRAHAEFSRRAMVRRFEDFYTSFARSKSSHKGH